MCILHVYIIDMIRYYIFCLDETGRRVNETTRHGTRARHEPPKLRSAVGAPSRVTVSFKSIIKRFVTPS